MTVIQTKAIRRKYFQDRYDGAYTTYKRQDEVLNEGMEFINDLDGETISTATWDTNGPTISGTTVTTGRDSTNTKVTWTVTDAGSATLQLTTSGSRTLEYRFRWIATDIGYNAGGYN